MKRLILILLAVLLVAAPAYAQRSFDMRYNEAVEFYTTKQYDKAIKTLEAAKKSPGVTKDQIAKADRLMGQCRSAKQKQSDLNLSKETIFASGSGQVDSIYVTAGKAWQVTSQPSWCNTRKEADVLYIEVLPNEEREPKKGMIEVTMGKERTAYIVITQERRIDVACPVHINTYPERAILFLDNEPGMLAQDFVLAEGAHKLRIEKSGYERKDTTFVLSRNDARGITLNVKLVPAYAAIRVSLNPAEGYFFDSAPVLDVSGNEVNLHPSTVKSFNLDQDLSYYSLYEDSIVPLHPGQYTVKASAEGFVTQVRNITATRGSVLDVSFELVPIFGSLSLDDEENAAGAVVTIDGKEAGIVPLTGLRLKSGKHLVKVEKPGYVPDKDEYEVEITEDKNTVIKVSMLRYASYEISSDPAYCKVYLDGEYVDTTPLKLVLREGEHELRFEKTGHYPKVMNIKPELGETEQALAIKLDEAFPLLVTADIDGLGITLSQGNNQNKVVYAEGVKTPATIELPHSDKPYTIELTRPDLTRAFKGRVPFKSEKDSHFNALTWSDGTAYVSGSYYLLPPAAFGKQDPIQKGFRRVADVNLAKFKLLPGLSSNVAKATLFWQTDASENIVFPGDDKVPGDIGSDDPNYKNVTMLPAFSIIFINEEFRLGGAIIQNLDVNMLLSYAWYPNLSAILQFNHMSGHDMFAGIELNSRFPIINGTLKAGVQAFHGQANLVRPVEGNKTSTYVTQEYSTFKTTAPVEFVISLGFSVGGKDHRGQNILRVF